MKEFRIEYGAGRSYRIAVEEVAEVSQDLIRVLIEIDLQTFSEATFSNYTARGFLDSGRIFLLKADDVVIGSCVCLRSWERPHEATVLTMGIRPGWRGRGLGQRFLHGILDRLVSKGMRGVSLLVGRDNRRALKIYEETGFDIVKELQPDQRTGEVFVLMRKVLQDDAPVTALPGLTETR